MKHYATLCGSLAAAVLCPGLAGAAEADSIEVGGERQLFVDRAFIAEAHEVSLRLHPARKTGEKVLQYDKPWESATLNWFTVLQDRGVVDPAARYRMWYECYDVPGWPTADDRRHLVLLRGVARWHALDQARAGTV